MPTKLVVLLGNGPIVVAGTVAAVGFVVAAAVGTIKVNDRDIAEGVGVTVVQTLTEPDTFVELDDVPPRDAEPVEGQGGTVTEPDTFVEPDDVPQFDVVRVDGRGDVVIGGRARPRASVLVLLDGVAIGETDASAAGHFVAMLSISPAEVPRVLSLVAQVDDGAAIPGEDTVIIAPFELTEEAPLVEVETTPGPDGEVTSPSVLLANADGVRVLQPSSAAPDAETGLRLDAISYDLDGDVSLAGRGSAEMGVRVTLDDRPMPLEQVGPGGQWWIDLPDVDPGTYMLRVEQVASNGLITEEVVTPFLREDPERLAANPMLAEPGASVITVQPEFTLWGIAEANFGDGVLYIHIFEENRDTIRDPDLIIPGQVFRLPDLPQLDR